MILNLGFASLLSEEDSLSVIEGIGSKEPNFSMQGNLTYEIQSLLSQFAIYDVIDNVGRRRNEIAYLLTRYARFVNDIIR